MYFPSHSKILKTLDVLMRVMMVFSGVLLKWMRRETMLKENGEIVDLCVQVKFGFFILKLV